MRTFNLDKNQMPKLATVLKDEIVRLARKEVRAETSTLRKAAILSRTDVSALKRRVAALEKQLTSLIKTSPTKTAATVDAATTIRFSSKGFAALRRRLDLSATEIGFLLDASDQSIYKWERGVRPSPNQMPKIAALRKMSKPQVAKLLKSLKK
jgi:DNA-binding transcriptional regulator YiaG